MSAGKRDQFITIERASAGTDSYGETTETWSTLVTGWARVVYGRGEERRQSAQEQASQIATFELLSNEVTRGILPTDRIVHLSANWDILAPPAMDTPRRGEVAIEAMRAA